MSEKENEKEEFFDIEREARIAMHCERAKRLLSGLEKSIEETFDANLIDDAMISAMDISLANETICCMYKNGKTYEDLVIDLCSMLNLATVKLLQNNIRV